MADEIVDIQRICTYWMESSDADFKTMTDLFETKNYSWSLFMGHLVIEKLLKAYYVKSKGAYPPLIHDLRRIGELADIKFGMKRALEVETISQFNIKARYDDYKRNFYQLCTP
jgi:HEPN domain-containing protein